MYLFCFMLTILFLLVFSEYSGSHTYYILHKYHIQSLVHFTITIIMRYSILQKNVQN